MRSHEGVLLAENLETGGALFTLELPMTEVPNPVEAPRASRA
jgi:K+-sensing histidine kinase KdpD